MGGATATAVDLADRRGARMIWFIGFVVALSMLRLLGGFRSVFIPDKAAVRNLLGSEESRVGEGGWSRVGAES